MGDRVNGLELIAIVAWGITKGAYEGIDAGSGDFVEQSLDGLCGADACSGAVTPSQPIPSAQFDPSFSIPWNASATRESHVRHR